MDYLILPDEATIGYAEKRLGLNLFNLKTRQFQRKLLATGRWEPISGPLVANEFEAVLLYANRKVAPD